MEIKGFAADIDMTLTGKGEDLPEITKQAFEILHKHNIPLGLATGRQLDDRCLYQGKNWGLSFEFDFLVCMNGGQVYDAKTKKVQEAKTMSCDDMKEVFDELGDLIHSEHMTITAEGLGNIFAIYLEVNKEMEEVMLRHGWRFEDVKGDLDYFASKPCWKLLFRTIGNQKDKLVKKFNESLKDKYQIIETFPGTFEIMHQGIDKGSGLAIYAEWNNLTTKDFICFGDNENDNTMLKAAGLGVALKGCNPKTIAIADDVTDVGCFEGGVGDYLFKHVIIPNGWDK